MEFLYFIFFLVAFLYSSVGHGGASSYLALLAIMNITDNQCKSSALVLNILVASIAFFNFYRVVNFPFRTFLWLILGSIPASFLGSKISIDPVLYKFILGCLLLLSAVRLFDLRFFNPINLDPNQPLREPTSNHLLMVGIPIGLISGMIGIGGGIILSPIILFFRWHDPKETAAVSAGFIVLNSISGLIGNPSIFSILGQSSPKDEFHLIGFVIAAFIGGIFGSWKGAVDFSNKTIKKILALVLVVASTKLIIEGLDAF